MEPFIYWNSWNPSQNRFFLFRYLKYRLEMPLEVAHLRIELCSSQWMEVTAQLSPLAKCCTNSYKNMRDYAFVNIIYLNFFWLVLFKFPLSTCDIHWKILMETFFTSHILISWVNGLLSQLLFPCFWKCIKYQSLIGLSICLQGQWNRVTCLSL